MIKLDFSNVERLVFSNQAARYVLPPYFANYFECWNLAQRIPALKQLGRQAMYDLLNGLNDDHILSLEKFFGERIFLEKLNYNAVTNMRICLEEDDACKYLCNLM